MSAPQRPWWPRTGAQEFTTNGWPLHLASAELDVLGGRPGPALAAVDEAAALGFLHDEMWHWITEIAISAHLLQGDPAAACARSEAVVARVDGSAGAERTGRLLALTARAHADLADLDPAADRAGIGQELLQRADRWGAFRPHPARVKAAGYAMTFQAELARLTRSGEEVAWRAARDLWSEHGARAEAGYASARLAAALLAAGHRKEAEVELSAAYAVAVVDAPLRRQVLELARLGRLTPTNADTDGRGDAALVGEAGDLRAARTDLTRARRSTTPRNGRHERRDRASTVHEPEDGERACERHHAQTGRYWASTGGDSGRADGPSV